MIDDSDETPVWGCVATVERPYEIIVDNDEIPWGDCNDERPYETIDDRDEIP